MTDEADAAKLSDERVRSIGHYILAKTIGEGTFGKVKLGTHILTGENVAVKILEKDRIVDVADVERVAREIHILKLIRHPHIIQLYEIIETPRQLYLIMEYASGGELFDYIVQQTRVKEPEAVRFFHQILVGVEKMHEINVVHRDLKPENLLLDEQKHIKIVDFGLSNTFVPGQLLKTACGSPCYAAPEMIAGYRYVPSLCDMWSCGVILFALLCGYLPFEDQNTSNLYRKITSADYKCPSFLSKNGRDLIRRLLTIDPTKRITPRLIKNHPWYMGLIRGDDLKNRPPELQFHGNGCRLPQCRKCQQETPSNFIDDEVMSQLVDFGFPQEYATRCLQLNKHNHATTTYYLLFAKKTRLTDKLLLDNAARELDQPTPTERKMELVSPLKLPPREEPEADPQRSQPVVRSQPSQQPAVNKVNPPQSEKRVPLIQSPRQILSPRQIQYPGSSSPRTPLAPRSDQDTQRGSQTARGTPLVRPRLCLNLRGLITPRGTSPVYGLRNPVNGLRSTRAPVLSTRLNTSANTHRGSASSGRATPQTPMTPPVPRLMTYNPPSRIMSPRQAQTPQPEQPKRTTVPMTAREHTQTTAVTRMPLSARGPASGTGAGVTGVSAWSPVRKVTGVQLSARERYRGAFSFSSMSRKPMKQVVVEVKRALTSNRVDFKQTTTTSFVCQRPSLRFDVEMKEEGSLTYVRLTRVSGELWLYNDTCSKLLSQMRL